MGQSYDQLTLDERCARAFMSVICIAATVIFWL